MAAQKNSEKKNLIDPIYKKYRAAVLRALGDTEFYEFFMDAVDRGKKSIQFSNRKLVKTVDLDWVDALEESLQGFQNIIANPRNVIKEEELIVNVANAKKAGPETVRHLAQHASLVDNFDEVTGDVRPAKMMQRYHEESTGLYENRLVFTTMEIAYNFIKLRHDALFDAMNDEYGAKLKVESDLSSATEQAHLEMYLHIRQIDDALTTDKKNSEVFDRISRIYRMMQVYMNSEFAQQMSKLTRTKGSITRTNVLKKNPDYKKIVKLLEFLRQYNEVGYTIEVIEQSPQISPQFEQDIYHTALFQYIILKGYLEDPADREIPAPAKGRKRKLKPHFIRQIVEELTEDYDLPDVEVRKVLIEELTKEQLMQEEEAERLRLVEEKQARDAAAQAEKQRQNEQAQAEAAEKERAEAEAAAQKAYHDELVRKIADRRCRNLLQAELEHLNKVLPDRLQQREKLAQMQQLDRPKKDYADAAQVAEQWEELQAAKLRERKEQAHQKRLKLLEKQREAEQAAAAEKALREAEEQEMALREAEIAWKKEQEAEKIAQRLCRPLEAELYRFAQGIPNQLALRAEQTEATSA